MDKIGQLDRARSLLSQALNVAMASMPNNRSVVEASGHIRSAIQKIDGVAKIQMQKKKMTATQFETWWGNVQAGTAKQALAPVSAEANMKKLAELNSMIAEEKSKLDQLEALPSAEPTPPDELLQD